MLQPLQPVINTAKQTVSKADAAAFLTAITALSPLPAGKTNAQIQRYSFGVNATTGEIDIVVNFSS
jgi:hypothetical protein